MTSGPGLTRPVFCSHSLGQHRFDDFLDDGLNDTGLHPFRSGRGCAGWTAPQCRCCGLAVQCARDLALGVRAQEWQAAASLRTGSGARPAVRVVDGRGHQLRRFVAGVANIKPWSPAQCSGGRRTHGPRPGDVVGLLVVTDHDGAAFVINAVFRCCRSRCA